MITELTVAAALGVLGWGFYRARPYGKVGILAWFQSVVLMAPWLLFFGLFAIGIYLNLAAMLLLFVASTGAYILIGRQLRAAGQDVLAKRAATLAQEKSNPAETPAETTPEQPSVSPTDAADLKAAEVLQAPQVVPIPAEDLQVIKGIFGIDTFFCTETIPYQEGAIFKGNLRGDVDATFTQLTASLKAKVGDRYRLFLVQNQDDRPVVVVLPAKSDPKPSNLTQQLLAIVLFLATIATSLETGGILLGFDFYNALDRYREVLPFSVGIMAVLIAHEIGHGWVARRYNVKLSLPYFIPTWQIGSFGGITRFESYLPNRTALFDIAFAGPAIGGILSFLLLIAGLLLSQPSDVLKIPPQFFEGSILVGTIARAILGNAVQQDLIAIHPLVVIGWVGLLINALNLMPAGQLDGGRIVQAIYGRKTLSRLSIATILVLGVASFVNPLALYWAIVIGVVQRGAERPSLNELTEPDDARAALGLLGLFLMVTILLPLTPSLAGRLGFGG